MKVKLSILTVILLVCSFSMAFGQGITLERTEGLVDGTTDRIIADGSTTITFVLRFTNDADLIEGMANGFKVYSDDGATWTETFADTVSWGWTGYNLNLVPPDWGFLDTYGITLSDVDGMLVDTVGYGGAIMSNCSGVPANFDEESYLITIGPIATTDHGRTICLDTCFYRPTGYWMWVGPGGSIEPAWDGPHCFIVTDPSQGISSRGDMLPTSFDLSQNYPNPFNPTTQVNFDVPTHSQVNISVFNVLGQKTVTLVDEEMNAGSYVVDWDGTSDGGNKVSSGIYFYRMEAGSFVETKKMMLLK